MPLDQRGFKIDEWAPGVVPPFAKGPEGLRRLAYVLRHPELWASRHRWNFLNILEFAECGTQGCAVGIACLVWPEQFKKADGTLALQRPYYLTQDESFALFACGSSWTEKTYGKHPSAVTPEDVADAIDRYLSC